MNNEVCDVLEMDTDTLREFLAGMRETERGQYITLDQAKKQLKIRQD